MKKTLFCLLLVSMIHPLLAITKMDIQLTIMPRASEAILGTKLGINKEKKAIAAQNTDLDKLYDLFNQCKSFVTEKSKILGIKDSDLINPMNKLEPLVMDLINSIKITRGIKSATGLAQQSSHFNTIATTANTIFKEIQLKRFSLTDKKDAQAILLSLATLINTIATRAKNETFAASKAS